MACQGSGCCSVGEVPAWHASSPRFALQHHADWKWWWTLVISKFERWEQEDQEAWVSLNYSEFNASLSYMKPCLKKRKRKKELKIGITDLTISITPTLDLVTK